MVYFQTKNPNLGKILECLAMKDVGKFYGHFYGHLVYFSAIGYISWPFDMYILCFLCIFPVLVHCITENLATLDYCGLCRLELKLMHEKAKRGQKRNFSATFFRLFGLS
jgi:hypothetical protein